MENWEEKRQFIEVNNFAQQGKETDRRISEENHKGNYFSLRDEFAKDRDRIIFSRAFRRLEHKAQIYSHQKGDHFRTRLTHTLEVAQIARKIARNLNLNEALAEAIALGHDIGHTPFGHQGERTLDDLMIGKDTLSNRIYPSINYGGFKHNFHSLKILDELEVKFKETRGMNLTWQVMEGILKHTKTKRNGNNWPLNRFIQDEMFLKECMELPFSFTLEGQIVNVSDEIAQRQHDIDDGVKDNDLNISYESIAIKIYKKVNEILDHYEKNKAFNYISKDSIEILIILKNNIKENLALDRINRSIFNAKEINNVENSMTILENIYNNDFDKSFGENGDIKDYSESFKINQLTRDVIDFFITDVTTNSMNNILKKGFNVKAESNNRIYFKEKLVDFSYYGKQLDEAIEEYIKAKILNSYNVNRFDGNSRYIIKQLFKAYYANPRQMPKHNLERLQSNVKKICSDIYNVKILFNGKKIEIKNISFNNDKKGIIESYTNLLKFKLEKMDLLDFNDNVIDNKQNLLEEIANFQIEETNLENLTEKERYIYTLKELRYYYLSTICDYIAGMTDNYAIDEFKKLYNGINI
ncbi:deoxyguanosinetriphosphate triphosphohydrolase family protein [Clostridium senegalense]|uniref:deoxyguanosinetriphosphate triphosphohydrolase family protein n=1 Tax=Clostridium senegalense TaxID=1465809 RepID=UPI0002882D4E|nr:dNTP triphosphohydrolase [Clostridium senegalense]